MTEQMPFETVLVRLSQLAVAKGAEIMLMGATARDVALHRDGLTAALRATEDVDIAVAVAGMDAFDAVTSDLTPVAGAQHKFTVDGIEVDVVPFGDIETAERTVTWSDGTILNTLGLREAFDTALVLGLPGGLAIRVATLTAQAALKVFAWADRSSWTMRDGADLGTIIDAFSVGPRIDILYSPDNEELLSNSDFNVNVAGAHLLGRDIRIFMGAEVANAVATVITVDLDGELRLPAALRLQYPEPEALLRAFRSGLASD